MNVEPILQLKNVSKTFNPNTANENTVLKNIDLSLQKGDFVTIIGGNGAGKSTLLNAVAGTIKNDSGSIEISGKSVDKLAEEKRAKRIARVFQDPQMGTAPRMTVSENLSIASLRGEKRVFKKTDNKENQEKYKKILSQVGLGLEDRLDQEVGLLSGGQRQVIALIMATIKEPELLLLDEHTAALDPKAAKIVMELTDKRVKEKGITTVMITHNMQQAIDHGNRLIMMSKGRIVLDTSGKEKQKLTIEKLLELFKENTEAEDLSDRMLLS